MKRAFEYATIVFLVLAVCFAGCADYASADEWLKPIALAICSVGGSVSCGLAAQGINYDNYAEEDEDE